jgi:hypothetical protein
MYTIKVSYHTGDSFNTYDLERDVGLVWQNKELARKALRSIKEHYDAYEKGDNTYGENPKLVGNIWYDKLDNKEYWAFNIACELDDGSYRNIHCGWCGYFEALHSAEIILDGDDEDAFELR